VIRRSFISVTVLIVVLLTARCGKKAGVPASAMARGTALVEVGGSKQVASIGALLEQPVVVQVNDQQGVAVKEAQVSFSGLSGVAFDPPGGLTDASGQLSTAVSAPGVSGRFQVIAITAAPDGKSIKLVLDEIALGYEQVLGRQLNAQYCARCHDPESSAERVSNMDNLDPKPHAFTEGDTLNKISDSDLISIISRGGPALNKSASMPPYGYTLSKSDIHALVSYIREIADPPFHSLGLVYANK
jgi:mono/diheme cytochrome c family protein